MYKNITNKMKENKVRYFHKSRYYKLMNLPSNPAILLSMINMWLRDQYDDLDSLCDDKQIDKDELIKKLNEIDYHYQKEVNQFK